MWAVFRKSDGKLVATSPAAKGAENKKAALEEVVRGLVGEPPLQDFDAVEVEEEREPPPVFGPGRTGSIRRGMIARPKEGGHEIVSEEPEEATLSLTTNATQFHPVDKVPLIPGNGEAFLVVTLQKADLTGKLLARGTKDNEVVWLRTDHGTLREDRDENPQEIRSVTLVSGRARFRIYSEKAKRLATVQMLSENPSLHFGGLRVEFV